MKTDENLLAKNIPCVEILKVKLLIQYKGKHVWKSNITDTLNSAANVIHGIKKSVLEISSIRCLLDMKEQIIKYQVDSFSSNRRWIYEKKHLCLSEHLVYIR